MTIEPGASAGAFTVTVRGVSAAFNVPQEIAAAAANWRRSPAAADAAWRLVEIRAAQAVANLSNR